LRVESRNGEEILLDRRIPIGHREHGNDGNGVKVTIFDNSVPNAKKWWPVGYGDQILYTVKVDLLLKVSYSNVNRDLPT
jgi:hypothetical protein